MLLVFFGEGSGVSGPGDVISNVNQKLDTIYNFDHSTIGGEWGVLTAASSLGEDVVFTPPGQLIHLLSVQ